MIGVVAGAHARRPPVCRHCGKDDPLDPLEPPEPVSWWFLSAMAIIVIASALVASGVTASPP